MQFELVALMILAIGLIAICIIFSLIARAIHNSQKSYYQHLKNHEYKDLISTWIEHKIKLGKEA